MAIRITGMYSGLDTEAIISELVSAQSVKKSKYVKDQTKLSWKMDAWKALNTKIYNFYTNTLDNMRFQSTYMKKIAKVSNSNALSVVVNNSAVNGTQSVKVDRLATIGKVTGRDLSKDFEGKNIKSSTKLSELGIDGDASFDVTVGGKKTSITVNGDMKISDVVSKLKSAGLNASFDDANHRFFISSKESGEAADFTITANNTNGLDALESLGLLTKLSKDDPIYKEYQKWADYLNDDEAYQAVLASEVAKRAAAYKKTNDGLAAKNAELQKAIDEIAAKNDSYSSEIEGKDADDLQALADELYNALYGDLTSVTDDEGNTVQERQGGLQGNLNDAKANLQAAQDAKAQRLAEAEENGEELSEDDIAALDEAISVASQAVSDAQTAFNEGKAHYNDIKSIADKQSQIEANKTSINENHKYYDEETVTDEDGNETVKITGSDTLKADVKKEFDAKVALADDIIKANGFGDGRKYGDRIKGVDAVITVDGAEFTSSSNDFNINGMQITVYETTDSAVTVTTSNDVDGIYDMIKNFFKEYNSLINEMSALYNADSAKGYDPLTSEEKAEMADSEIEEWEKKIKDSLLRRDSTLGDLTDAIKTVMIQGATVNGKTMYLSDFGINTLGYFNAADNEKGAYHIYGDPDDADVKGEDDVLKAMLASDPDTVMNFFSGLSKNLYDKLSAKMAGIKDTSSAFTVYNDKLMQKEYDAYKEKIAKEEDKLNALMDKWYEKFSRMETAMAKLQSKSNGLGNMLGGQ